MICSWYQQISWRTLHFVVFLVLVSLGSLLKHPALTVYQKWVPKLPGYPSLTQVPLPPPTPKKWKVGILRQILTKGLQISVSLYPNLAQVLLYCLPPNTPTPENAKLAFFGHILTSGFHIFKVPLPPPPENAKLAFLNRSWLQDFRFSEWARFLCNNIGLDHRSNEVNSPASGRVYQYSTHRSALCPRNNGTPGTLRTTLSFCRDIYDILKCQLNVLMDYCGTDKERNYSLPFFTVSKGTGTSWTQTTVLKETFTDVKICSFGIDKNAVLTGISIKVFFINR